MTVDTFLLLDLLGYVAYSLLSFGMFKIAKEDGQDGHIEPWGTPCGLGSFSTLASPAALSSVWLF